MGDKPGQQQEVTKGASPKSTPRSPGWWEITELASLGPVLEMCPQQRWSTVLLWSLPLAGKGFPGASPSWVDSSHADSKNPVGLCPGQLHLLSESGQYKVLAHGAPSWITLPIPRRHGWTQTLVVTAGVALTCSRLQLRQWEGCFPASLVWQLPGQFCCQDKQLQSGKI